MLQDCSSKNPGGSAQGAPPYFAKTFTTRLRSWNPGPHFSSQGPQSIQSFHSQSIGQGTISQGRWSSVAWGSQGLPSQSR